MESTQVKFNEWLLEGFNVFKNNILTLVLASLLVLVISFVTIGILAGPMLAGLIMMILGFYDKVSPEPQVSDVFKGFQVFLPTFLFGLVFFFGLGILAAALNVIPIIGQILALALNFLVGSAVMFGMFLIVDKQRDFWPAAMESWEMIRTNLWPFIGFGVVAVVISQIGVAACGIGIIVTMPIGYCIVAVAYREVFCGVVTEEAAPAFVDKDEVDVIVEVPHALDQPAPKVYDADENDAVGDAGIDGVEDLNGPKKDN